MHFAFVSSIPKLDYSCANMYGRNEAGTAFSPRTTLSKLRSVWCSCSAAPAEWAIEVEIRLYRDRAPVGAAAEGFWAAVVDASA